MKKWIITAEHLSVKEFIVVAENEEEALERYEEGKIIAEYEDDLPGDNDDVMSVEEYVE